MFEGIGDPKEGQKNVKRSSSRGRSFLDTSDKSPTSPDDQSTSKHQTSQEKRTEEAPPTQAALQRRLSDLASQATKDIGKSSTESGPPGKEETAIKDDGGQKDKDKAKATLAEQIKENKLREKIAQLEQEVSQLMEPGGEKELSERLDQLADEGYLPFFRSFDDKVRPILAQLPWFKDLDGRSTKEIKRLGLDKEKMEELGFTEDFIHAIPQFEKEAGIADLPIPGKIKEIESSIRSLEKKDLLTEDDDEALKGYSMYLKYSTSLQETLRGQYGILKKEVENLKGKRNTLINLPNLKELQKQLKEKDQEYLTFFKERPRTDIRGILLREAVKHYKTELGPDVVSPLVLARADKLVEQASETVLDRKIKKKQEMQKNAAEDLGLEDYDHVFFLKSQRHETDYYIQHPNLVILKQKQGGDDCGKVCVRMVADKNKSEVENAFESLPKAPPEFPLKGDETRAIMYPIVLKKLKHPIEYEYMWDDTINDGSSSSYLHQEYFSSTGRNPRKITVEQLKNAISQKREEEPIFALLCRIREDREPGSVQYLRGHVILIDAIKTIHGEAHVIYRDSETGQGHTVSWKDFLEDWNGDACIPVEVVP